MSDTNTISKYTCVTTVNTHPKFYELFTVSMGGIAFPSLISPTLRSTVDKYNKLISESKNLVGMYEPVKYSTVSAAILKSRSYSKVMPSGLTVTFAKGSVDLSSLIGHEIKIAS